MTVHLRMPPLSDSQITFLVAFGGADQKNGSRPDQRDLIGFFYFAVAKLAAGAHF